ncbi:LPFR motif small protein [Actinophytocola xanthii]|nr:LPFR motif small protein [Actinophytocola xanthii]
MARPARRGKSALGAIADTAANVVTLPFRVIGRLFGGSRRKTRAH